MANGPKVIIGKIIHAFKNVQAVDANNKKSYIEVADAAYDGIRGLPREQQLAKIRELIQYVNDNYSFPLNYIVPSLIGSLPEFVKKFVSIVKNKKKSLDERAEELLLIIMQNSPDAQKDLAKTREKALDTKQLPTTEIPVAPSPVQQIKATKSRSFSPIKTIRQGANRMAKNVAAASSQARQTVFGKKTDVKPIPAKQTTTKVVPAPKPTSQQLARNYQELTYDLLDYVAMVHDALFTVSKTFDQQGKLTEEKFAEFKEYSSVLHQISDALSNNAKVPDNKIDQKALGTIIYYTSAVMDIATKIEREYKSISKQEQQEFSQRNVGFVNRVVDGIAGVLSTLLKMKDAANAFINDKVKLVKKNLFTASDAAQVVNKGQLAASTQETVKEYKTIANGLLAAAQKYQESAELATVKKSTKSTTKMRGMFNSVFGRLGKSNQKLEARVETNMQHVTGKDMKILVDNIDHTMDAGNLVATTYRTVTGKQPKQLEDFQEKFEVKTLDRTAKLLEKVQGILGIRKVAPVDPEVIDQLNGLKQKVYIKAMNVRDLKRD